jgi:hypothetical protein
MSLRRVYSEERETPRVERRMPMTENNRIPPNLDHAEEHWVR